MWLQDSNTKNTYTCLHDICLQDLYTKNHLQVLTKKSTEKSPTGAYKILYEDNHLYVVTIYATKAITHNRLEDIVRKQSPIHAYNKYKSNLLQDIMRKQSPIHAYNKYKSNHLQDIVRKQSPIGLGVVSEGAG
jgi:hypothetical protein